MAIGGPIAMQVVIQICIVLIVPIVAVFSELAVDALLKTGAPSERYIFPYVSSKILLQRHNLSMN